MLNTKEAAGKAVENRSKLIMSKIGYKKVLDSINHIITEKHKIPLGISNDYISLKKNPADASNAILFSIMEAMDTVADKSFNPLVTRFFEESEIAEFKKYKFQQKKILFPLQFEATQVTDTQWIGRITVQQLMELAPIITYNENTQRSLRKVVSGEVEVYSIFLNRKALAEITESYQNNSYIPNTITLNIPEDVDYKYENGKLIFKTLDSLDILDGYHRYVAMTNLYSVNNDFDYAMEVRWVSFNEDKAKQFIWQEDQKTKMTKLESATFNQTNPGNQVINMLDQVTMLHGIVNRNGNIDAGIASSFINLIWFNKPHHNYNRKEIVEVKRIIEKGMSDVINLKPEAFDKPWNRREAAALFLIIGHEDIESLFDYIDYINKEETPIYTGASKRELTRLEEAYQTFKG